MYVPIRDMITGPLKPGENPSLLQKIMAGMTTGALGISVANPTDVVKIRLQAQGRLPVEQHIYKGATDCYRQIIAANGVKGLWIGVAPNIMRNSIINAAEIASYDQYKEFFTQSCGFNPVAFYTHFVCAFGAGFNAVIVGSPVDVLKTRMMNAAPGQPTGLFGIIADICKNQGLGTFYKGFSANFMRLGSWNVVMFVTLEQTKKWFDRTYGKKAEM
jgi:solute carrier family 25 (mitochondrial uncoupling protein), member 8/9